MYIHDPNTRLISQSESRYYRDFTDQEIRIHGRSDDVRNIRMHAPLNLKS